MAEDGASSGCREEGVLQRTGGHMDGNTAVPDEIDYRVQQVMHLSPPGV